MQLAISTAMKTNAASNFDYNKNAVAISTTMKMKLAILIT
jgi:hypothetical protein